jgi:hypothetical protein
MVNFRRRSHWLSGQLEGRSLVVCRYKNVSDGHFLWKTRSEWIATWSCAC